MKSKLLYIFIITFLSEMAIMLSFEVLNFEFESFWTGIFIDSLFLAGIVGFSLFILEKTQGKVKIDQKLSRSFAYLLPGAMFLTISTASIFQYIQLDAAQKHWNNYLRGINERVIYLGEAYSSSGYTGFIHQFKNYILRKTPSYYNEAIDKYHQTNKRFDKFLTTQNVSQNELQKIRSIQKTLELYFKKLNEYPPEKVVSLSAEQFDSVVKIDDHPSIAAINWLDSFYKNEQRLAILQLEKTAGNLKNTLILSFFFATCFILFLAWQLIRQTKLALQSNHELDKAQTINAMVTTFNHEINNPLTIAIGFLKKAEASNIHERKDKVLAALNRIKHIVKAIDEVSDGNNLQFTEYTSKSKMIDLSEKPKKL